MSLLTELKNQENIYRHDSSLESNFRWPYPTTEQCFTSCVKDEGSLRVRFFVVALAGVMMHNGGLVALGVSDTFDNGGAFHNSVARWARILILNWRSCHLIWKTMFIIKNFIWCLYYRTTNSFSIVLVF